LQTPVASSCGGFCVWTRDLLAVRVKLDVAPSSSSFPPPCHDKLSAVTNNARDKTKFPQNRIATKSSLPVHCFCVIRTSL
jgi:hypothetical protein